VALTLPTATHPLPVTSSGTVSTTPAEVFAGLAGRPQPLSLELYTTSSAVEFALDDDDSALVWCPLPASTYLVVWDRGSLAHGSRIYLRSTSGTPTVLAVLR
jgi:hypothetical protein